MLRVILAQGEFRWKEAEANLTFVSFEFPGEHLRSSGWEVEHHNQTSETKVALSYPHSRTEHDDHQSHKVTSRWNRLTPNKRPVIGCEGKRDQRERGSD